MPPHAAEVWARLACQAVLFAKTEAELEEWWRLPGTQAWLRRLKHHHPDLFEMVTSAKNERKAALKP